MREGALATGRPLSVAGRYVGRMTRPGQFTSLKEALKQPLQARTLSPGKQTKRLGTEVGELVHLTELSIVGPASPRSRQSWGCSRS